MPFVPAPIATAIRESFPIRDGDFELSCVDAPDEPAVFANESGEVFARIELRVFDIDEHGAREVRDMKQQDVCFVPAAHAKDADRAVAFVRGVGRAMPAIARAFGDDLATCMPLDFVPVIALDDPLLRTEDDFARALSDAAQLERWRDETFRSEVRSSLEPLGLEHAVDELLALRRDAIHLSAQAADDVLEVGETRFGGEPDLPPSFDWPRVGSRPLTFVAQLDLDDLAELGAARELPSHGVLAFFYDAFPEGTTSFDHAPRVFHFARAELVRRPTPEGGDRRPAFTVDATVTEMMPPLDSPYYEALLPERTAGLADVLMQWQTAEIADGEAHRVLGYATPYQGDPLVEVELHSTGGNWDGWDDASADALRTRRTSRRWRLLLQVAAMIDGTLLLEQDCGALYFLIPEDALATHDWSRVRCVMQCS